MSKLADSGVFFMFIPEIKVKTLTKTNFFCQKPGITPNRHFPKEDFPGQSQLCFPDFPSRRGNLYMFAPDSHISLDICPETRELMCVSSLCCVPFLKPLLYSYSRCFFKDVNLNMYKYIKIYVCVFVCVCIYIPTMTHSNHGSFPVGKNNIH